MCGWIQQPGVFVCSGGGVHPVLPQTHERHRGHAVQHELHQQQPGHADHRPLQPQRGRRHQGQKGQIQKVITRSCLYKGHCKRDQCCFFFLFEANCFRRKSSVCLILDTRTEIHQETPPLCTGESQLHLMHRRQFQVITLIYIFNLKHFNL